MTIKTILANKTGSISEFRTKPEDYFTDEPVAVLSGNKPIGYLMNAELYEQLIHLKTSQFRPSRARLTTIAKIGSERLLNASDNELGDFKE